jgi:hypothetical protein
LYRGIDDFKKGYQHRNNIVKDEKSGLVADIYSILSKWRNHFCQVNDVRQTEVHKAESLLPELSALEILDGC